MSSVKVKRKLFKAVANVEECYKMLISQNVTNTEMNQLCKSVRNVDLKDKDCVEPLNSATDGFQDFTGFLYKEKQEKALSPHVNDSRKKKDFKDQVVQTSDRCVTTCEVGIQVDLCPCSQTFREHICADSPVKDGKIEVNMRTETLENQNKMKEEETRVSLSPQCTPLKNAAYVNSIEDSANWTSQSLFSDQSQKGIVQRSFLDISSSEEISFKLHNDAHNHCSESPKFSQTIYGDKDIQNLENKHDSPVKDGKIEVKKKTKTLENPKKVKKETRVSLSPQPIPLKNAAFVNSIEDTPNWTSQMLFSDQSQKDIVRRGSLDISSSEEISFILHDDDAHDHQSESLKFSQTSCGDTNIQNHQNKLAKYGGREINIEASKFHLSFLASLSPGIEAHLIHPEARRFVANFASTKVELGQLLFDIFNDKVFSNKLPVFGPIVWNTIMGTSAGFCRQSRVGSQRTYVIDLAVRVCDTPDKLRDTLIHEMCHAYVWMEYGSREAHGAEWRKWAIRSNVILKELPPITRCHSYEINSANYIYICQSCGYKYGYHKQLKNVEWRRCNKCKGAIQLVEVASNLLKKLNH